MRIVANEKGIAWRARVGKYATLAGLGVLLLAFILSLRPTASLLLMQAGLMAAMILGIMLSFIGGYYGERFAGPLAHHLKVREALKGSFDRRYVLYQYVLPAPHVLLGPDGLTVFLVKSQGGKIAYQDGKWKHQMRGLFLRRLAGQEALGEPHLDLKVYVDRMKRYLEKRLPGVEVPIQGAILFVNPAAELSIDESPVPAFYGKKVRAWLRGPGTRRKLPAEVYRKLEETLGGSFAEASEDEKS